LIRCDSILVRVALRCVALRCVAFSLLLGCLRFLPLRVFFSHRPSVSHRGGDREPPEFGLDSPHGPQHKNLAGHSDSIHDRGILGEVHAHGGVSIGQEQEGGVGVGVATAARCFPQHRAGPCRRDGSNPGRSRPGSGVLRIGNVAGLEDSGAQQEGASPVLVAFRKHAMVVESKVLDRFEHFGNHHVEAPVPRMWVFRAFVAFGVAALSRPALGGIANKKPYFGIVLIPDLFPVAIPNRSSLAAWRRRTA